jgi:peptidoglycan L-alanyl-D-glutamate endopeptidase CwlK
MAALSRRSLEALAGVHPDLVRVLVLGLSYSPHDFSVSEGIRSSDRQRALFDAGTSKTMQSKHLRQADGFGYAADVVATGDLDKDGDVDAQDRTRTWDRDIYSEIAAAVKRAADELGVSVRWGGDFKSWFDGPHFELA